MKKLKADILTGQVLNYPQLDPVCAFCQHFCWKPGNPEHGQAYCRLHDKWFPGQLQNKQEGQVPAGKRTCQKWLRITKFLTDQQWLETYQEDL